MPMDITPYFVSAYEAQEADHPSPLVATLSNRIADNLGKRNETLGLTTRLTDDIIEVEWNNLLIKTKNSFLDRIGPAASMALDIFSSHLLKAGSASFKMSVADYQKERGLDDYTHAREEMISAGELLANSILSISNTSNTLTQKEKKLFKEWDSFSYGIKVLKLFACPKGAPAALITFSADYIAYALGMGTMLYLKKLRTIDLKRYKQSWFLSRKLYEHWHYNFRKSNTSTISLSVETLLSWCGNVFPSEQKVSETNRNYRARIIIPFEKNMDYLASNEIGAISWEYRRPARLGGGSVSREEASRLPFKEWKILLVQASLLGLAEEAALIREKKTPLLSLHP